MDTREPVQILPDWLKLKMIRSSVDRLVDAALQDLTPDQIVLFVQNFGTPVSSMSKLLALLDRAVIEQLDAVKAAVLNTIYLAQLIEIQQGRGAKNGHIAVQALELNGEITPDPPRKEIIVAKTMPMKQPPSAPSTNPKSKEFDELFEMILQRPAVPKSHMPRFRKMIAQITAQREDKASVTKTQYLLSKILQHMHRVVTSSHRQYIVDNSALCTLFRSIFIAIPEKSSNHNFMINVIDQFIQNVNPSNCPILFQILFNKRKSYAKSEKDSKHVEKHDLVQVLKSSVTTELESKGNRLLNELTRRNSNSGYLIDIISNELKASEPIKQERLEVATVSSGKTGLLVDWLADIDSELVVSTTGNQLDLLFNRSLHQFRFYLLSLLSHQASWYTLQSTVNKLLEQFNENYDPTSVLHFIEALIRNPKLWQGRDKGTPKHQQIEYVLKMNDQQLTVFADYALNEATAATDSDKLSARVEMLLQCAPPSQFNLRQLAYYVRDGRIGNETSKRKFMQKLYLENPWMKFTVAGLDEVYISNAKNLIGCEVDKVANYTLTAIAALSTHRDYQAMSANMELLVRKLAASHPALLLRQLSVLATLLEGRAHMEFYVLRNQQHLSLFYQVMGLVEILQPHIFDASYKRSLQQVLACYFELLQNHGHLRDLYPLLCRFIGVLQAYTQHDPHNSLAFIESHAIVIQNLSMEVRNLAPLQQILQGISLLKHKSSSQPTVTTNGEQVKGEEKPNELPSTIVDDESAVGSASSDNTGAAALMLTPMNKFQAVPPMFTKMINEVLRRTGDEVLGPLQELEAFTSKKTFAMDVIFERLLSMISSPTSGIRNSAYVLLIRCLKQNPGCVANNAHVRIIYLACLRDKDTAIALSALEHLTEMVICLQEHATEILRDVFEMGLKSKHSTYDHIRRCVLALKTQHAC